MLIIVSIYINKEGIESPGFAYAQVVTDASAGIIVREEIVPNFKEGNFYGGIDQATDVLIDLLEGNFTQDEYVEQSGGSAFGSAIGSIFFIASASIPVLLEISDATCLLTSLLPNM